MSVYAQLAQDTVQESEWGERVVRTNHYDRSVSQSWNKMALRTRSPLDRLGG